MRSATMKLSWIESTAMPWRRSARCTRAQISASRYCRCSPMPGRQLRERAGRLRHRRADEVPRIGELGRFIRGPQCLRERHDGRALGWRR